MNMGRVGYIHFLRTECSVGEHTWTQEIKYPYRRGETRLLRFPFTTLTAGVGRWTSKMDSEWEALEAATGARKLDVDTELVRTW